MTRLSFHPEAILEYEAAAVRYEQLQRGLGARFVASVGAALQGIVADPTAWPALEADVRRRLTRVFPYAILYAAEPDAIVVLAVMHCHRKPGYWRSRAGT